MILPLLLLLLFLAREGRAASAKDLFEEAVVQLSLGKLEEATRLLEKARRAAPDRALLGRIELYSGLTLAVLGEPDKARAAFRRALTNNPAVDLDPKRFKASTVKMFNRVRGTMFGALAVSSDRAGAQVFVDGKRAGTVPYRGRHRVGAHVVDVVDPDGTRGHTRTVLVGLDRTARFRARLGELRRRAPSPAAPRQGHRRRLWTWISAAGAVATLGAAIGLGAAAARDHAERDEVAAAGVDRERWAELRGSGRAKAVAANVMFGVGGALAAAAIVLYFVERAGGRRSERKRAARSFGGGAALVARF